MARIWLIRHGESEANSGLATSDPATIALTIRGVGQAEKVAFAFVEQPSLIVVSPYRRTKETARPTIERFPNVSVEEWPVQEFTYLSPEQCRNSTAADRRPMVDEYWARNDPNFRHGTGAETFAEFFGRVEAALKRALRVPLGLVAVFSHGLLMRAVLWTAMTGFSKATPEAMHRYRQYCYALEVPNAAIVEMQYGELGRPMFSNIDTSHL